MAKLVKEKLYEESIKDILKKDKKALTPVNEEKEEKKETKEEKQPEDIYANILKKLK